MRKTLYIIVAFFIQYKSLFAYDLSSSIPPSLQVLPYIDNTAPVSIFSNIIAYAIGIAGILAVIGVTIGGVQMVLAAGDDEKLKKGRYTLIYSLIGVLIAGMAYGLVDVISKFRI